MILFCMYNNLLWNKVGLDNQWYIAFKNFKYFFSKEIFSNPPAVQMHYWKGSEIVKVVVSPATIDNLQK